MEGLTAKTVKEFVTDDHRTATVFEKYSIDFCCNGGKSIETACAERGVDPTIVIKELQDLGTAKGASLFRPTDWDLDVLADFIVNNHHRYVRRMLPVLLAHMDKVVSVHGENHPELSGIAQRVHAIASELRQHMQKEETVLFPYVRALVASATDGGRMQPPPFGSIRNPIRMIEAEHQSAGDGFFAIRVASKGYTPPAEACTTYRVTYQELEEFERDLHQHVHLENNILFPKAIELESRLFSGL